MPLNLTDGFLLLDLRLSAAGMPQPSPHGWVYGVSKKQQQEAVFRFMISISTAILTWLNFSAVGIAGKTTPLVMHLV